MTQLANNLFENTPPLEWHKILKQQATSQEQSTVIQLTYSHGQFNISEQKLQVSHHYLSLIGADISTTMLLDLLCKLENIVTTIEIFPILSYPVMNSNHKTNGAHQKKAMACVLGLSAITGSEHQVLTSLLQSWRAEYQIDFALVNQLPTLTEPGIVLMDMDSTTIQIECIDEIAKLAGVGKQVAAVTAKAMNGELDFSQSLHSRVATLEGCPESVLATVADNMPLMPGLEFLIDTLHKANWKVAIASGGFTFFAERLKADLGFDAVYANQLEIADGTLTGHVIGDIVDAQAKSDILLRLAKLEQLPANQMVAIGDGANDLLMLNTAALGVAIHAKPTVQQQAQVALNHHDLDGLVGLLRSSACLSLTW